MNDVDEKFNVLVMSHARKNTETAETNVQLIEDLGYNSIGLMQLLDQLQDAFDIEFDEDIFDIEILNNYSLLKNKICTLVKSRSE